MMAFSLKTDNNHVFENLEVLFRNHILEFVLFVFSLKSLLIAYI